MIELDQIAESLSDRIMKLTLMPTEQCNFRCVYCYEDFIIGKMKRPVIEGVKALLAKRIPELKVLTLDYFGGEPLVARNIVYEVSGFAKDLIEKHYPDVRLFGQMTTNGFALKPEVFEKLLAVSVNNFQITLDGPREIHNKTRLRINKSGSFDTIWANLLSMKSFHEPFQIVLRIHITPDNLQYLDELIKEVKLNFDEDHRFGIFFKAIENLGGPNTGNFKVLTGVDKNAIINKLYENFDSQKNVSPLLKKKPYICYASKPNNLVIRANGRIAKCTVAFNDERNDIGKINEKGNIEIDQDKLNLWTRGMQTRDEPTLKCPLHGLPKLKDIPIQVA